MEMIFFIVNNGAEDDIDAILISLKSKVSKALSIRIRNMCLVIREYIRNFTTNGMIASTTTMADILEWKNMDRHMEIVFIPMTKPKLNDSISEEECVSNTTRIVNRQCLTLKDTLITLLPKIREQQYQVKWEEDVNLEMGSK